MKTIQLPGGMQISISGLSNTEAYHRAMDQIGAATAPLKAVLDILTLALGIKRTLEAASDIPTDPSEFLSRLREITITATKLLRLLPQVSVPVLVQDICGVLVDLIQIIRDEIADINELMQRKRNVEAAIELDPALQNVALQITVQEEKAKEGLAEMLEPLAVVGAIIDTFLELISQRPLGLSAAMSNDLNSLDAALEQIQDILRGIV